MSYEEQKTTSPAVSTEETPSEVTMTQEQLDTHMHEVYMGERDTMPDGTPVKEIHANIQKLEKEQDEARAKIVTKTYDSVVGSAHESNKVTVNVTSTGVVSSDPIAETETLFEAPKAPSVTFTPAPVTVSVDDSPEALTEE